MNHWMSSAAQRNGFLTAIRAGKHELEARGGVAQKIMMREADVIFQCKLRGAQTGQWERVTETEVFGIPVVIDNDRTPQTATLVSPNGLSVMVCWGPHATQRNAKEKIELAAFTVDTREEAIEAVAVLTRTHLNVTITCHTTTAPTYWLVSVWEDDYKGVE